MTSQAAYAVDCEMVGINRAGETQMLARVSIVNEMLQIVYDKYVKPQHPVSDLAKIMQITRWENFQVVNYRTSNSGIKESNVVNGEIFEKVQMEVADRLRGRILVGHALQHDLAALRLEHPPQ